MSELTIEQRRQAELTRNTAEVSRSHTVYTTGATGMPVQTDHTNRVNTANATHTEVLNSANGTTLNKTLNWQGVPVYTGGNVVKVATTRATSPSNASDIEDLEMEVVVRAALDSDTLFTKGGHIPPNSYLSSAYLSPYVDGAFLAEASKMTGEKLF